MAEYNPSKIIKDGNTYNFRDTTKIPLAGSNQISGDLIPSTDGTVNLGGSSYQWNNAYIKSLTINGVACGDILTHNVSEFVDVTSAQTIGGVKTFTSTIGISKGSGDVELAIKNTSLSLKANTNSGMDDIRFIDKDNLIVGGLRQSFTNSKVTGMIYSRSYSSDGNSYTQTEFNLVTDNQNGISDAYVKCDNFYPNQNATINLGTSTNKWKDVNTVLLNGKTPAYNDDVIPRSGGAVLTDYFLGRSENTGSLMINGGTSWSSGGSLETFGSSHSSYAGWVRLQPALSDANFKPMNLEPSGTWTWSGTACQITSDQRLKQQITEINDKLLDAWEDVELSQFKYNDAVNEKGNNARLHTGYVVQQIDEACKSHGVDISAYGLYCHEEYPEETKEVEVEQADGTKVKETRVIREASEHYSLRYTEALIVECKYLRRCIARLTARIEELGKGNNSK